MAAQAHDAKIEQQEITKELLYSLTKFKMKDPTIYIDAKNVHIDEALKILTDDFVDDGNYSAQTVIDLRDAVEFYVKLFEASCNQTKDLETKNKILSNQVSRLILEAYMLQNEKDNDYFPLA